MLEIRVSQNNEDIREMANIALKARLYVSGWCLSTTLSSKRTFGNKYDASAFIVLAYHNGVPVGVMICSNTEYQAFVRKSYRRQGIGFAMASECPHFDANRTGDGVKGSESFWNKLHIFNKVK